MESFRNEFIARFRFVEGHADVLGLLADAHFFASAVAALAEPFGGGLITKVAGVEARGFILGAAVAARLEVGFVPVRKAGSVHPGPKAERRTSTDWRGLESVLQVQRSALRPGDRVALVDDWAETGSQALAARALIEDCGSSYAGLSMLVDQLPTEVREALTPFHAVVQHDELEGSRSRA